MKILFRIMKFPFTIKGIALTVLLICGLYFVHARLINKYLTKVCGVDSSAELCISELFTGRIVFSHVLIGAAGKYKYKTCLIKKIEIVPDWKSFFTKKKQLKSIVIDGGMVCSQFIGKGNNISTVSGNIKNHFSLSNKKTGEGSVECLIDKVTIKNMFFGTVYQEGEPLVSRLPDVYLKGISSSKGVGSTIAGILTKDIFSGGKIDGDMSAGKGHRSFLEKTWDGLSSGVNFSINAAATGVGVLQSAANSANQINYAVYNIKNI